MMKLRRYAAIFTAVLALMLVAAACGGDDDGGTTDGGSDGGGYDVALTGTITISGSSTVQPISTLVAELFNEVNPDVAITVDGPGTGDGFELFCDGDTDISDASRPIEDEEKSRRARRRIEYVELEVAFDGITVMTNPANRRSVSEPRRPLRAVRSRVRGLRQLVGADALAAEVGGTGGFPDARSRSRHRARSRAPTTPSSTWPGSRTPPSRRGSRRTRPRPCGPTTRPPPNDNVIIQAHGGLAERARVRRVRVRSSSRRPVKEIADRRRTAVA